MRNNRPPAQQSWQDGGMSAVSVFDDGPVETIEVPKGDERAASVKAAAPSRWIWVPFCWLAIASTRSLSHWLNGGLDNGPEASDESGGGIDQLALAVLIILGTFVLARRAKRTTRILNYNKWVVALFIYTGASILWSNFPGISLRRWTRLVGTLLMALVVLTESDPLASLRAVLRRLFLVHIPLSIITIKYFRAIGVQWAKDGSDYSWVGLTLHKNCLGQVSMISGFVFTWQVLQNWARKKLTIDLFFLVAALGLLRGAPNEHSSSSIIAFLVGVSILLGLQRIRKRPSKVVMRIVRTWVTTVVLLVAVGAILKSVDLNPIDAIVEASGRDTTFTGRTGLWTDVIHNAAKSPLLGVGIGAFWVGPIGNAMYPLENWSRVTPRWRPNQGHNGYVDAYVCLGFVGLALVLGVLVAAFRGAITDLGRNFEFGRIRLAVLVAIVLDNVTESSMLTGTHMLWIIFLLVAINVPARVWEVQS